MEGFGAKVNFDDEDPDLEGWSDVEDSDISVGDDRRDMDAKEAQFAAFDGVAAGVEMDQLGMKALKMMIWHFNL